MVGEACIGERCAVGPCWRLREAEGVDSAARAVDPSGQIDGSRQQRVEGATIDGRRRSGRAGAAASGDRHETHDVACCDAMTAREGDDVCVQNDGKTTVILGENGSH